MAQPMQTDDIILIKIEFFNGGFEAIHDITITPNEFDQICVGKDIDFEKLRLSTRPFGSYWIHVEEVVQNFFALLIFRGYISYSFQPNIKNAKHLNIRKFA